jgi:hypothetical protein
VRCCSLCTCAGANQGLLLMCQKSTFDARTIGGLGAKGSLVGISKFVYSAQLTSCQQRRSHHSQVLVSSNTDTRGYIRAAEILRTCQQYTYLSSELITIAGYVYCTSSSKSYTNLSAETVSTPQHVPFRIDQVTTAEVKKLATGTRHDTDEDPIEFLTWRD